MLLIYVHLMNRLNLGLVTFFKIHHPAFLRVIINEFCHFYSVRLQKRLLIDFCWSNVYAFLK
jgi:hypothetical protein